LQEFTGINKFTSFIIGHDDRMSYIAYANYVSGYDFHVYKAGKKRGKDMIN